MSQETVYAIASGKGGVGKTTTTVNLGTALAGVGNRVVIVDADLGMANLAGFVSLGPEGTSLHDVLSGSASVESATYELADGIWAIPSGVELDGYANASTEELTSVVETLRDRFDYVLLDVGAGVSHESVLPLGLADATLLVSTTDPAAVQDATKTVDLVGRAGGTVGGLVVTRTRPNEPVSAEDVAEEIGGDLLVAVPEDPKVRESVHAGTPLVVHEPKSPAAQAYRYLAARLLGEANEDERPQFGAGAESTTTADGSARATPKPPRRRTATSRARTTSPVPSKKSVTATIPTATAWTSPTPKRTTRTGRTRPTGPRPTVDAPLATRPSDSDHHRIRTGIERKRLSHGTYQARLWLRTTRYRSRGYCSSCYSSSASAPAPSSSSAATSLGVPASSHRCYRRQRAAADPRDVDERSTW